MVITTKLGIDLQRPLYAPVINAVQGDQNTRCLEISFYSGGAAFELPENVSAVMRYRKPDKTKGFYDTMPDGAVAYTVSGNTVTILIAPQMLTVPGVVLAQVVLMHGSSIVSTFSMTIHVEADPAAGVTESEDYTNWVTWIETELDAYLEKLKVNGEFVGGTLVGAVNMNGNRLYGLRYPTSADDAATVKFVQDVVDNTKALPLSGGTMTGSINMNGQKITGLNTPAAGDEAANKDYVDTAAEKKKLPFTNKSVSASSFASNSTYADYPYRAAISLPGVVSGMVPEVVFGLADAVSGNFAPVAEAYNGGVYIWAAEVPEASITIPTIICWREA